MKQIKSAYPKTNYLKNQNQVGKKRKYSLFFPPDRNEKNITNRNAFYLKQVCAAIYI